DGFAAESSVATEPHMVHLRRKVKGVLCSAPSRPRRLSPLHKFVDGLFTLTTLERRMLAFRLRRVVGPPSHRKVRGLRLPIFALIRRGLLSLMLVAALVATPSTAPLSAQENTKYAAIVVDAESGEVLFARYADSPRYPASITKVMTLYLTFEALTEGKVKLDDVLTISPRAASQPPSKLGLAAGQTITLDNAMKATAVRSANDMAMAIAE